uniref:VP1054 n=1 Tax=Pieris brassicae granulosis virus TaxID=10465 RepID=A0A7G9U8L3_GVPB|nr:VP1054 [Pieris brassicae granulovirus]
MNCVEVATARSTAVYQPVRTTKRQCRFHPHRANCNLIQTKGLTKTFYHHYTTIDMRYCSVNGDPFYEWLLSDNKERRAHRFQNAYKSVCGVIVESEQGEIVRDLDEAGEIDTELIRMVMRYVYEYLENDKSGLNGHAKTIRRTTKQKCTFYLTKCTFNVCTLLDNVLFYRKKCIVCTKTARSR